jgi:glycine cleavage system H protein
MSTPANLKYTTYHEWVKNEADGTISVGITHHAQELLGDMVFVETPEIGSRLIAHEAAAAVESVKAAADVYAPVNGVVTAVNSELESCPEAINNTPYAAWIFKMKPDNDEDVDFLLHADDYQSIVNKEKH